MSNGYEHKQKNQIALTLGCNLEREVNNGNLIVRGMCDEWWHFVDRFETLTKPRCILGANQLTEEMRQRLGITLTTKSVRKFWRLCISEMDDKRLRGKHQLEKANIIQFQGTRCTNSGPKNIAQISYSVLLSVLTAKM